jgi:hypothetical protein
MRSMYAMLATCGKEVSADKVKGDKCLPDQRCWYCAWQRGVHYGIQSASP